MLCIIGRKSSKPLRIINRKAGIPIYIGRQSEATALVNYGLAGAQLDSFYCRKPSARGIPTINGNVGYSKLSVVNRAEREKIQAPESKLSLAHGDSIEDFIEKRTNSVGGIGIKKARGKGQLPGKYYQRFIKNRRYEIRVHAFKWMDINKWPVQKRVGPEDVIAWNYKQGGHFITVGKPGSYGVFIKAREISEKILNMLGMSFGAVDFVVDNGYNLWFLEVNSAPGFTDLSEPLYIEAFKKLNSMSKEGLSKLA